MITNSRIYKIKTRTRDLKLHQPVDQLRSRDETEFRDGGQFANPKICQNIHSSGCKFLPCYFAWGLIRTLINAQ